MHRADAVISVPMGCDLGDDPRPRRRERARRADRSEPSMVGTLAASRHLHRPLIASTTSAAAVPQSATGFAAAAAVAAAARLGPRVTQHPSPVDDSEPLVENGEGGAVEPRVRVRLLRESGTAQEWSTRVLADTAWRRRAWPGEADAAEDAPACPSSSCSQAARKGRTGGVGRRGGLPRTHIASISPSASVAPARSMG